MLAGQNGSQSGLMVIALGIVGQMFWHSPQPTQPGDSTSGGPLPAKRIAVEPNGQ